MSYIVIYIVIVKKRGRAKKTSKPLAKGSSVRTNGKQVSMKSRAVAMNDNLEKFVSDGELTELAEDIGGLSEHIDNPDYYLDAVQPV